MLCKTVSFFFQASIVHTRNPEMSAQHSYWRLLVVVHWNSSAEFLPVNFAVWLSAQDLKDCQQLHFVFWVFKPTSKKCAFDREMQCTRKEEMLHIPLPRSLNFRHCCWPQISARRTPRSHCLKIQQMVNCMKAWTPSLPYFTCKQQPWAVTPRKPSSTIIFIYGDN